MFVGLSVHIWKLRFPVDWILQVEECIANIGIPLDIFVVVAVLPFRRFLEVGFLCLFFQKVIDRPSSTSIEFKNVP